MFSVFEIFLRFKIDFSKALPIHKRFCDRPTSDAVNYFFLNFFNKLNFFSGSVQKSVGQTQAAKRFIQEQQFVSNLFSAELFEINSRYWNFVPRTFKTNKCWQNDFEKGFIFCKPKKQCWMQQTISWCSYCNNLNGFLIVINYILLDLRFGQVSIINSVDFSARNFVIIRSL